MSWAEEDWTVGLSGRVLQKVKELQVQHERLSRENKQKQLLLDNIQTSLEKQTAKYEQVRSELQSSHRELQKVQEEAKAVVSSKERFSLDLQTKHAQVCSLEGQLDAAKTLNNKLTQEVKRLEAELEKLQNSSRSADTTLFSTPCWSSTSPWEHNGSRKEERHGNRDEENTQGLHVRRLQFSDMSSRSTPHRQPPPDVFSTPSAAFPWEREDSKLAARRPSPASPKTPYTDAFSHRQLEQANSPNNSDSDSSLSELRIRLTDLEEELRVKAESLKSVQNEAVQTKKELLSKELSLQKLRDELSQAHTRMAKESERASSAEQKAKQLLEDLKCQRQNAESSRVQHQQKTKELEKQHQRDLQEFQKERQFMERQHQQEINKLNQELAQARTLHNALQAQIDKLSLQKQVLDKEVETLKEKLKWTEGQLQQSQKNEAQTQAKLTESLRETEAVTVSLKQSQKKERALEEDLRRVTEEGDDAQRLLKELQAEQKAAIVSFQPALQSYSSQPTLSYAPQPSAQARRSPHTDINTAKSKREEAERRSEIMPPYPTDREPGEGIDSEHISGQLSRQSERLQIEKPRTLHRKDAILDQDSLQIDTERATDLGSKQVSASTDLQAENAALRAELRDVREELQKRLDDLEAHRRAEAEARTRLKQLSRKNANQVTEKEEQYKECKAQLEKERAETEMMKKIVASLEAEITKQQEKDKQIEGDKNDAPHDREDEMIELNIQLKKQLSEVKAQLALEREERRQEEEEKMNKTSSEIDLNKRIEELEAEIKQLKASKNNISQEEEAMSVANSPLTYLTLREDEMNSNVVTNKPDQQIFCQSSNQRNTMLSQAVGDYIQPGGTLIDPQEADLNQEDKLSSGKELFDAQSSELAMQVQHLQRENTVEKERANQYQIKLEALQNQVTQQTKQLTMAFEKQSQHISGLLLELQDKQSTLISAEEELQQYKQELNALKTEMNEESKTKTEKVHCDSQAGSTIANNESLVSDSNANGQEELHLTSEAEVQTEHYVDSDSTIQQRQILSASDETDCENKENADMSIELLNLQQENHLLKLKLKALTVPEPPGINTDIGNGGELPLDKLQTPIAANDGRVQACTEESGVCSEEPESEEHPEAVSQRLDQISCLQQQVMALQNKLQALSEENQQKTQELALWRLSSDPAPVFVQSTPSTELDTVDQGLNASQSHNKPEPGPDERQYRPQQSVTFVREDEVLLSCSSNKLQGRTLFSRLQHNVISEPKTPRDLHELIQDNSESDKENTSPTHHHQRIVSELVTKEIHRGVGVLPMEALDVPIINAGPSELKNLFINRYIGVDMKCVSTQTEILLEPPEILCTQTRTEILQEGEEEEEEEVDSHHVSPVPFLKGQQSKVMLAAGSFPIPADPASLAERIRRNRTQLSAAFDDTEYEPYGLPEVVMKGFADIPSGPSCPYIVRRGLLGTTAVPVPSKNTTDVEETD